LNCQIIRKNSHSAFGGLRALGKRGKFVRTFADGREEVHINAGFQGKCLLIAGERVEDFFRTWSGRGCG